MHPDLAPARRQPHLQETAPYLAGRSDTEDSMATQPGDEPGRTPPETPVPQGPDEAPMPGPDFDQPDFDQPEFSPGEIPPA